MTRGPASVGPSAHTYTVCAQTSTCLTTSHFSKEPSTALPELPQLISSRQEAQRDSVYLLLRRLAVFSEGCLTHLKFLGDTGAKAQLAQETDQCLLLLHYFT